MKRDLAGVSKRLVAGVLVTVAVVGVSALAIHAPSQSSATRSLNSIQTDKDATENLKLVAAAL